VSDPNCSFGKEVIRRSVALRGVPVESPQERPAARRTLQQAIDDFIDFASLIKRNRSMEELVNDYLGGW
jgi:hypothetical protein